MVVMSVTTAAASNLQQTKISPATSTLSAPNDWNGLYVGGHLGYMAANSYWNTEPGVTGVPLLAGSTDIFDDDGPWGPIFGGLQAGYNYITPSHLLGGVEADFSFPNHQSATRQLTSAAEGQFSITDTIEFSGTARVRVGLAMNNWLLYGTGGFAFDRELMTRNQIAGSPIAGTATPGDEDQQLATRLGWTIGLGTEFALSRHWGIKLDYLFTDYGSKGVIFSARGRPLRFQPDHADATCRPELSLRQRIYLFDDFQDQRPGYHQLEHSRPNHLDRPGLPAIFCCLQRSAKPASVGRRRETASGTGFIGLGLWNGAALYYDPELLQGLGLSGLHGVAGFPNGEAQKANTLYPHYNTSRIYYQQVFGFGGEQESIDDEPNQIAQKVDVSRFTFTIGKVSIPDFFDDNTYAHEFRTDFMNYAIVDSGAFDYAADQFDYTWGMVGELNQKTWAVRGGYFLVPTVQEGGEFDTNFFRRGQYIVEGEDRYSLFSQPGKIRIGAWLSSVFAGSFVATLANPALNLDIAATRQSQIEYGFYASLEQAVTSDLGVFSRLSWRNGQTEIMSFTDIDRSLSLGGVLKGTSWSRPDDRIGLAVVVNELSSEYRNFLAAGGLGDIIGDRALKLPRGKNPRSILCVPSRQAINVHI